MSIYALLDGNTISLVRSNCMWKYTTNKTWSFRNGIV
jgi:hypothetical protein